MPTHETRWPITDQSMTIKQLIAEATDDLADIIDAAHAVMIDDPVWRIDPGERPELVATTRVRTIPVDMRSNRRRKHVQRSLAVHEENSLAARTIAKGEATRECILDLLDDHPNLSAWEIARVLRISTRTVQRHMTAIQQELAA